MTQTLPWAFHLARFLAYLPDFIVSAIIFLARIFVPRVAHKETRVFFHNVNRVFGLPSHSVFARSFFAQCLSHQIWSFIETFRANFRPGAITLDGYDELQANVKSCAISGRGLIFVTAHLGAWELCAQFAAKSLGRPLHVLAKPPRSASLRETIERLRANFMVRVLWTDRKTLLREMVDALGKGEGLGFVMDQKPEGRVGVPVEFFGARTEFVAGPATFALKYKVPVVALFVLRVGSGRYRLLSRVIWKGSEELTEESLTAKMANEIERMIRLFPEQWTWNYKRWRIEPAQNT